MVAVHPTHSLCQHSTNWVNNNDNNGSYQLSRANKCTAVFSTRARFTQGIRALWERRKNQRFSINGDNESFNSCGTCYTLLFGDIFLCIFCCWIGYVASVEKELKRCDTMNFAIGSIHFEWTIYSIYCLRRKVRSYDTRPWKKGKKETTKRTGINDSQRKKRRETVEKTVDQSMQQ